VGSSCGNDIVPFLKCACAGLFLQSASRDGVMNGGSKKGKPPAGGAGLMGRYKTTFGGFLCNVHPTSTLFQRNPAPKCVVYTELVVTKKNYLRGVTQIKHEWLGEVAPAFRSRFGAQ
jgi:hypothetical protein